MAPFASDWLAACQTYKHTDPLAQDNRYSNYSKKNPTAQSTIKSAEPIFLQVVLVMPFQLPSISEGALFIKFSSQHLKEFIFSETNPTRTARNFPDMPHCKGKA